MTAPELRHLADLDAMCEEVALRKWVPSGQKYPVGRYFDLKTKTRWVECDHRLIAALKIDGPLQ